LVITKNIIGEAKVTIFTNKRSELEIVQQLLYLATMDTKKTRLMYQTNLCYSHFLAYMEFLTKKGFLEIKNEDHAGPIYHTTEKGKHFLESIQTVMVQVK